MAISSFSYIFHLWIVEYSNRPLFHGSLIKNWEKRWLTVLLLEQWVDPESKTSLDADRGRDERGDFVINPQPLSAQPPANLLIFTLFRLLVPLHCVFLRNGLIKLDLLDFISENKSHGHIFWHVTRTCILISAPRNLWPVWIAAYPVDNARYPPFE